MKKAVFVLAFSLVLSLINISNGFCSWPISHTPAIEGIVTDSTTGKPIENVMINCVWMKSIWAVVDSVDTSYGQMIVLTDKDGRYSIKPKTTLHMLSVFDSIMFQVNHPLYEGKMTGWSKGILKHMKMGETQYNDGGLKINIQGKYVNGKIQYDMPLISLEEKYLKPLNLMREGKIAKDVDFVRKIAISGGVFGGYEDASYWKILRENNIPVNLNETFVVWDAIVANIISIMNAPQDADINIELHNVEKTISEELSSK